MQMGSRALYICCMCLEILDMPFVFTFSLLFIYFILFFISCYYGAHQFLEVKV